MATKEKDQFYIELCEKAGVIKRKLKPTTKHLGQAILINFINAIFYDETEPIFDVQELWRVSDRYSRSHQYIDDPQGQQSLSSYQHHGYSNMYNRLIDLWNFLGQSKQFLEVATDHYFLMTELISGLIAEDADIESNLDYSFDMMTQASKELEICFTLNIIHGGDLLFEALSNTYDLPEMRRLKNNYTNIKGMLEAGAKQSKELYNAIVEKITKLEGYKEKFYTEEIDYFFELPNIACGYIGSIEERADKEQLAFADKELETIIESLSNHEIVWNNPITSLAGIAGYGGYTVFMESQPKG